MTIRLSLLCALVASLLAFGASPARASLSGEVNAGRAIAARVDARLATCSNLSETDFEHLGEYVVERMVGSRSAHAAINARMDTVMGPENADPMHQALGRGYANCPRAGTGTGTGYGMMGGGAGMIGGTGGWGAMLGSNFSWMRNGAWQHMSRAEWQRAGAPMLGGGWMIGTGGSGWGAGAVIGVVLGALLLGGLAVYLPVRRRWRHGPTHPSPA